VTSVEYISTFDSTAWIVKALLYTVHDPGISYIFHCRKLTRMQ